MIVDTSYFSEVSSKALSVTLTTACHNLLPEKNMIHNLLTTFLDMAKLGMTYTNYEVQYVF
jgi:hypothetical protein